MVVEGPAKNHSTTNKPIGLLLITGKKITRDLLRGTGITDLRVIRIPRFTVHAYLDGTNQEFSQVFDPKPRDVPIRVLTSEVELLESRYQAERRQAEANNNREVAEELDKLEKDVEGLAAKATLLSIDDVTDDRFKFEDQKRKIAQRIYQVTAGKNSTRRRPNTRRPSTSSQIWSGGWEHQGAAAIRRTDGARLWRHGLQQP